MTRVLQISNYMYPHIGGIEQTCRDISDALAGCEKVTQKIICFNEDARDGETVCRRNETVEDTVNGVEVVRCGCFAKVASQSLSLSYPFRLKRLLQTFSPDTVILHYPNPFVSALLLSMLPKTTRLIVWWHLDIVKQKHLAKLFHLQNTRLCQRADRIIATSPNYIEGSRFLTRFKEKCQVIPSCIRPERFTETERTDRTLLLLQAAYQGKTICFAVGRHVSYKGMENLVRAAQYLDDSYVFLIGGKGPLTPSLKEKAKNDQRIVFLGRIPEEEITAYYKACDIFCFPSITKNEAFGLTLAEGMYFEKPAVTFTIPGSGVNYVSLNGVTGIECTNGDAEAFAGAIKALHCNPALRQQYGNAARERVQQLFLFEPFSRSVNALLEPTN